MIDGPAVHPSIIWTAVPTRSRAAIAKPRRAPCCVRVALTDHRETDSGAAVRADEQPGTLDAQL